MSIVATEDPRCREPATGDAVELLMQAKPRDLGGFTVGRLLPTVQRRSVGPFIFLDLMGPVVTGPGVGMDIKPHPHIGLSTVTYLFAGENIHRDSLGSVQRIVPGDLNIMTAGRGVVHSERRDPLQQTAGTLHGVQIWLGLPEGDEDGEPWFRHHAADTLPAIAPAGGVRGRVLLGEAFSARSPALHPSQPLLVDMQLEPGACLELPHDGIEGAVFIIEGSIRFGDLEVTREQLAVLRPGRAARLVAGAPARLLFLGGPALGHRYMDWNFVSSSRERIEQAKQAWRDQTFPKIPGDDQEYVPLPEWPIRAR